MNLMHIITTALNIKGILKEPISARRKVFSVLLHVLAPFILILPLAVIGLGDWSGIGWISLVSKICAVLMIVWMALWCARRMGV
jgi:hypothetical protein